MTDDTDKNTDQFTVVTSDDPPQDSVEEDDSDLDPGKSKAAASSDDDEDDDKDEDGTIKAADGDDDSRDGEAGKKPNRKSASFRIRKMRDARDSALLRASELEGKLQAQEKTTAYWQGRAEGSTTATEPHPDDYESVDAFKAAFRDYISNEAQAQNTSGGKKVAPVKEGNGADAGNDPNKSVLQSPDEWVIEQAVLLYDEIPDFNKKVKDKDFQTTGNQVAALMGMEPEVGGRIAYYLATHEKENLKICNLATKEAIADELEKIEVLLGDNGSKKGNRTSKAPAPISDPSKGTDSRGGIAPPEYKDMAYEDYAKRMDDAEYRAKGGT